MQCFRLLCLTPSTLSPPTVPTTAGAEDDMDPQSAGSNPQRRLSKLSSLSKHRHSRQHRRFLVDGASNSSSSNSNNTLCANATASPALELEGDNFNQVPCCVYVCICV